MAFGRNKKKIRVEFFDSLTEKMIGYDEMNRKAIPEDFKVATWVKIAGDSYKVTQVMPDSIRKAFKKGTLTVHLSLEEKGAAVVEKSVPVANLFRFPSKADHTPRHSGQRESLKLLEMAASDWRELEFTLASNQAIVEESFEKIEAVILNASTVQDGKTFYRNQHTRSELILPLRGQKLQVEALRKNFFPFSALQNGLTFMGEKGIADHAFVFRTPAGFSLYGQDFEEVIRYMGLVRPENIVVEMVKTDIEKIFRMMRQKELILVDWRNLMIVEANLPALTRFFLGDEVAEEMPAELLETVPPSEEMAAPIENIVENQVDWAAQNEESMPEVEIVESKAINPPIPDLPPSLEKEAATTLEIVEAEGSNTQETTELVEAELDSDAVLNQNKESKSEEAIIEEKLNEANENP